MRRVINVIRTFFLVGFLLSIPMKSDAKFSYKTSAADSAGEWIDGLPPVATHGVTHISLSDSQEENISEQLAAVTALVQDNEETLVDVSVEATRTYRALGPLFESLSRAKRVSCFSVKVDDLRNASFADDVGPSRPVWESFIGSLSSFGDDLKNLKVKWKVSDLEGDVSGEFAQALRGKKLTVFSSNGLVDINNIFLDLAPVFSRMPTLEVIDLIQAHDVTDEGAASLSSALVRLPNLRALYMAHNRIGDRGLGFIANALQGKPLLRSVSMAFTRITPDATPDLLKIALSPSMRVLNTRGTPHTWTRQSVDTELESGVDSFVQAMQERGYVVNQSWRDGAFLFAPREEAVGEWVADLDREFLMKD